MLPIAQHGERVVAVDLRASKLCRGIGICEVTLDVVSDDDNSSWRSCSWIAGPRFLVTHAEYGSEKESRAWWVDVDKRTLSPVQNFDVAPVERLARFSDGGFAAPMITQATPGVAGGAEANDRFGGSLQ